MSNANGLRLLLVARLSRAKTSDRRDGVSIEIQDATAALDLQVRGPRKGTASPPWARHAALHAARKRG